MLQSPLNDEERQILNALLDTVIPPDDVVGAVEAGVEAYISRHLVSDPFLVDMYRAGLASYFGVAPDDLEATLRSREGQPFTRLLIQHALEGFYGDPGQGGNRDQVSWKAVGFRVTA